MGPEPKAAGSSPQPEWLEIEDFADIKRPSDASTLEDRATIAEAVDSPDETTFFPPTNHTSQALVTLSERSLRTRRKPRNGWIFVAIILVPVLVVGTIAAAVTRPTPVTVEITPRQERLHQAFNITVPTQTLQVSSPSYTSTHSVSGHVVKSAAYATGSVMFFNLAHYSQKVAGGTILTAGSGQQFKTLAEIIVPPAAGNPPVMGQAPAQVQALQPGSQGNIAARDINGPCSLCDPGLAALNSAPLTGGQDAQDYTSVLPQDIEAAAAPLQQQALVAAKEALQQQLQDGEKVIGPSLSCKPAVQSQPKAQEQATSVTVQVIVTCQELTYSQEQMLTHIQQQVQAQNVGKGNLAGFRLVGRPLFEITSYNHTEAARTLLTVSVTSHYVYFLNSELVRRAVIGRAGKPWFTVQKDLLSLPGVASAQLHGSDHLPANTSDITIRILNVS